MDGAFRAVLETTGRVSGRPHAVRLRAVRYRGRIYVSRHRPDSDWFCNALAEPRVTVEYDGGRFAGTASQVTDRPLGRRISELKYPGEERAKEPRVALEIVLDGMPGGG